MATHDDIAEEKMHALEEQTESGAFVHAGWATANGVFALDAANGLADCGIELSVLKGEEFCVDT